MPCTHGFAPGGTVLLRYLPALGEGGFKISSNLLHGITAHQQDIVFEMMVKAAVIQIRGADGDHFSVADALLGMAEAGGILINSDTVADKPGLVGPGDGIDCFLVRDAGGNDPHIHPTQSRKAQGVTHFIGNNQIGRDKPEGLPGLMDQI